MSDFIEFSHGKDCEDRPALHNLKKVPARSFTIFQSKFIRHYFPSLRLSFSVP